MFTRTCWQCVKKFNCIYFGYVEPRGFREVETCGGAWQIEFEIYNNGAYPLNSVSTYVQDTDTNANSGNSSLNKFTRKTGCVEDSTMDVLDPGATGYTVSLDLSNNPSSHLVFASVTLCTKDDLNGSCRTRELYFTPWSPSVIRFPQKKPYHWSETEINQAIVNDSSRYKYDIPDHQRSILILVFFQTNIFFLDVTPLNLKSPYPE